MRTKHVEYCCLLMIIFFIFLPFVQEQWLDQWMNRMWNHLWQVFALVGILKGLLAYVNKKEDSHDSR